MPWPGLALATVAVGRVRLVLTMVFVKFYFFLALTLMTAPASASVCARDTFSTLSGMSAAVDTSLGNSRAQLASSFYMPLESF